MISEIETALVDFVGGCLPAEVDVAPGPGEWDESYTRNLLTSLPAVRVVFDTAAQITSESFILLESSWVIFIAVGWKGGDEASRRVGSNGAYRFLDVLVPALHKVHLADATGKKSRWSRWRGWRTCGRPLCRPLAWPSMPLEFLLKLNSN